MVKDCIPRLGKRHYCCDPHRFARNNRVQRCRSGTHSVLVPSTAINSRKAIVGSLGFVLLLASVPLANAALERRFQAQNTTFFAEDQEREAFERAAWAMIGDSPLGVGPNHYVFIANTEGYSDKAGVTWASGSRNANVHNSYLLVLAETGYLGLFALIMLLCGSLRYAFGSAFRFRAFAGSEIFVGLGCAIVSIIFHSGYEWMLVIFPSQYLLAVALGLISGMRGFYATQKRGRMKTTPSREAAWRKLDRSSLADQPAAAR